MMLRRVGHALSLPVGAAAMAQLRHCISIVVPPLSDSVHQGIVGDVFKKVGDSVQEDEILFTIESEKATVEVNAPKAGKLTSIPEVGATVKVGAQVASIKEGEAGTTSASTSDQKQTEKKADAPAATQSKPASEPKQAASQPAVSKPSSQANGTANLGNTAVPPAERRMVVAGAETRVRQERISTMRRRIAERLKASQNTCAMLTTFNEIDMTNLINLREKHKDEFLKRHGVKLGFMSPFAKACATALQEVPIINASWCDDYIEHHDFVDISIAVATKTGLVVPVLRDVQDMTFADIEKKIEDYGVRAKSNKLSLEEMTGGTFTISNGGTFGSWMGTPIINPPQSAILGMHATKKKAWVNEKNELCVRHIMAVALTYDHRLIDGRDAVTFLVKVKSLIEDPVRLVLGLP
jgi:2-oxoglutarate dehydrogenase E2 component (dihydrolipoamide succinyltransferase)